MTYMAVHGSCLGNDLGTTCWSKMIVPVAGGESRDPFEEGEGLHHRA